MNHEPEIKRSDNRATLRTLFGLFSGLALGLLVFQFGILSDRSTEGPDENRTQRTVARPASVTEDAFVRQTASLDALAAEKLFREYLETDPLLSRFALSRWTRLSPREAAEAVVAMESEISSDDPNVMRSVLTEFVYSHWARQDQDAAILHATAATFPGGDYLEQRALASIGQIRAELDLVAGIEFAFEHLIEPASTIEKAFGSWAAQDRGRALAAVSELKGFPKLERSALEKIIEITAKESPKAARSLLDELELTDARRVILSRRIDAQWILDSPARALAALKEDPLIKANPERERSLAWDLFTLGHPHREFEDLRDLLSQVEDPARCILAMEGEPEVRLQARLISEIDGTPSPDRESLQAMESEADFLASRWAQLAPKDAFAWAASLRHEPIRSAAIRSAAATWAEHDPEQALLALTGQGMARGGLAIEIIGLLAERDRARARELVDAWPVGEPRNLGRRELVLQWAAQDFEAAERYVRSIAGAEENTEGLWSSLVRARTASRLADDYQATDRWIQGIENRAYREEALVELGTQWIDVDLPRALEFVNSLEVSHARQTLLGVVATYLIPRDPESALQWALEINRPSRREDLASRSIQAWARYNPTAAAQAWEQLNLPRRPSSP